MKILFYYFSRINRIGYSLVNSYRINPIKGAVAFYHNSFRKFTPYSLNSMLLRVPILHLIFREQIVSFFF